MTSSLAFALLPFLGALAGGYLVYRWQRDLHPWLSFSGGLLLGVAFLDLWPEAVELALENGGDVVTLGWIVIVAILTFHFLDRAFSLHAHHEDEHGHADEPCHNPKHARVHLWIRAGGMCVHRFFDGLAIGGGFAVSEHLGIVVASAVAIHSFADGMSMMAVFKQALRAQSRLVLGLLFTGSLAPLLGAALAGVIVVSAAAMAKILAFFVGFFLFLSLSELLPQAHALPHTRRLGFVLTVLGVVLVWGVGLVVQI